VFEGQTHTTVSVTSTKTRARLRFDRNKDVIDLGTAIDSIGPRQAVESERPAIPSGSPWNWKI
jgi:hypothetical protein